MTAATRRAALRGATAAGLAVLAGGTAVKAEPAADAALIAACDRFCKLEAAIVALHQTRKTIAAEQRTERELDRLNAGQETAIEAIEAALPARTSAGVAALARTLLAAWEKSPEGDLVTHDSTEWLAVTLAEAVCAVADANA